MLQTASRMMLGAALLAAGTHGVAAFPFSAAAPTMRIPVSSRLLDSTPTLAPMAFVGFCMRHPADCRTGGGAVTLTDARWAELDAVHRRVNAAITPRDDTDEIDHWDLGRTEGDCDDYAVQKRHELLARGWPPGALSLAVVRIPSGVMHLVLTVRTDRGEYVLDNLRPEVVPWSRLGYAWIKRQSESQPRHWVEVSTRRAAPPPQRAGRVAERRRPASKPAPATRRPVYRTAAAGSAGQPRFFATTIVTD